VLDFVLLDGIAHLDDATELQVELPSSVDAHGTALSDQAALRRIETDDQR
jgi:hypothetical protein